MNVSEDDADRVEVTGGGITGRMIGSEGNTDC